MNGPRARAEIVWRPPDDAEPHKDYLVSVRMQDIENDACIVGEARIQDDGQWWWANTNSGDYHADPIVPGPYAIADLPSPAPPEHFSG